MRQFFNVPREAQIRVINTGQTPARHLEIEYFMAFLRSAPNTASEFDDDYFKWIPTNLGRDQIRTVVAQFIGNDEKLKSAAESAIDKLYVFRRVNYLDMFSERKNITEFCYVYDREDQWFVPVGPVNSVR